MFLVISTSLSPKSRSKLLARQIVDLLDQGDHPVEFIDLSEFKLPRCDADACYADPAVQEIQSKVKSAKGIAQRHH